MPRSNRPPEIPPVTHWSFACDDELVDAALSWESDETTAVDRSGGIYRLDRDGQLAAMTRLRGRPGGVAASHDGSAVAVISGKQVTVLDATLRVRGKLEVEDEVLSADFGPFGDRLALSLASRRIGIFDLAGKKPRRAVEFDCPRPKDFIRYLTTRPGLVAVSEHDFVGLYDDRGRLKWEDAARSNCGGLAASGDGGLVALAAFTHGVVLYDADGRRRGSLILEASPSKVAVDHAGSTVAVATIERTVARLTPGGSVRWTKEVDAEVAALAVDGLGRSLVVGTVDGRLERITWSDLGGHEDESGFDF